MKTPTFLVIDISLVNRGTLLATCTVQVNKGPLFHECLIIEQANGQISISPPQRSWVDTESGKRSYLQLVKWPKAWQKPIASACRKAFQTFQIYTLMRSGGTLLSVENEVAK